MIPTILCIEVDIMVTTITIGEEIAGANSSRGGRGANHQGGPSYRPNQNRLQSEQCIVCFVSGNMNCPHCFHCGGSDHDRNNCPLN